MRVRMRVRMTGSRNGEDWPAAGDLLDVSDDEGNALIRAGIAQAAGLEEVAHTPPTVDEATGRATLPVVETATAVSEGEETADQPSGSRGKAARRGKAEESPPPTPAPRGPAGEVG